MAGEFCLDTNIAVAFLNGHPEVIAGVGTASRVALHAPTVGELLFGAKKSRLREANLPKFANLASPECERIAERRLLARPAAN